MCLAIDVGCAGDVTDTYFRDNQALNGASVWQNDCKRVVHSGSRFDNNAATKVLIVATVCCDLVIAIVVTGTA